MKYIAFILATMVLFFHASARIADAVEDSKGIEGTWLPAEADLAGQKLPDTVLKMMKLTIVGSSYTVAVSEKLDKGTIKLDPTAKPKAIDINGVEGPNSGKSFPAIYELTNDTLRICYDLSGKNRPTEFVSNKDTLQFLVSYKREKK